MTAPSTSILPTSDLRKTVAVMRAESLRRLGDERINKLLDALVDLSYVCNKLTERERICRFCNELETLKDVPNRQEIADIVDLLRSAFGLVHQCVNSWATSRYESVGQSLIDLSKDYPSYNLLEKLRPTDLFATTHSPAAVKAEVSQLIARLFVIAMNAENKEFRDRVRQIIEETMDISFEWM